MELNHLITRKVKKTNLGKELIILGAINELDEYIPPNNASKNSLYKCPNCKTDVILKKGEIKKIHYAHKQAGNCSYYDKPTESDVHRCAKEYFAQLIDSNKKLNIFRKCYSCDKKILNHDFEYFENCKCRIEYNFYYCSICNDLTNCVHENKKRCDIAYVDSDNNIRAIFEIYQNHLTKENNRPEPWYEFNAMDIINKDINVNSLQCRRKKQCKSCAIEENESLKKKILKH